MVNHRTRVIALCGLAALAVAGLVVAGAFGMSESVLVALATATSILLPGALDALGVERRRLDPNTRAIVDDVIEVATQAVREKVAESSDS